MPTVSPASQGSKVTSGGRVAASCLWMRAALRVKSVGNVSIMSTLYLRTRELKSLSSRAAPRGNRIPKRKDV